MTLFLDVVKCKLNGFQWSLELISSAVDTLQRLCRASAETPVEEQVRCKLSWMCMSFVCTYTYYSVLKFEECSLWRTYKNG